MISKTSKYYFALALIGGDQALGVSIKDKARDNTMMSQAGKYKYPQINAL
jgi:hypothetical protein